MSNALKPRVLYLEPFNGGSHAAFTRILTERVDADWTILTLPGRHWKWRMHGASVLFARKHSEVLSAGYDVVFASSFTDLAALVALAPALRDVPIILYFHENQFAYPLQAGARSDRDNHFGMIQLTSSLVATRCVFNSAWNRDSFLAEAEVLLRRLPDAVPKGWVEEVRAKSEVLPVPLDLPAVDPGLLAEGDEPRAAGPIILWNHRWEFDKNPEAFFAALRTLADDGVPFRVAACGQRYRRTPAVFEEARTWLGERVVHWGYAESRADYEAVLAQAHIAVSTADHEFFGISMLEATHFGAYPLVPDRLSYPELFPAEYRYVAGSLVERLKSLCVAWSAGEPLRADRRALTTPYGPPLRERYAALLRGLRSPG